MRFPIRLLFAHVRKSWVRSLLTVLSVFIAILIFGFLRTFIVGMETSLAASAPNKIVTQSAISLFGTLPKRISSDLAEYPEIKAQCHWTWFGGIYIDASPEHFWGRFGCDPAEFRAVYGDEVSLPEDQWAAWGAAKNACIVGKELAAKEKFEIGQTITLKGNLYMGTLDLEVVGIYESRTRAFDEQTLFMHWDYMNEVSKAAGGRHDCVSTFTMLLENEDDAPALQARIDAAYEASDNRTRTQSLRAFQSQFNSMWGNVPLFFTVIGSVVLFACLLVTANTMFLNARERIPEVGILKTLGFGPTKVAAISLIESVFLCLLGGAMALAVIAPLDGTNMQFVIASVPASTIVEGLSLAGLLGILSGLAPAVMTRRLSITEAVRRRA